MSVVNSFVLSLSLSADSFAASLGRASRPGTVSLGGAAATGAVFAAFETAALSAGWGLGAVASGALQALDHWFALVLLIVIGLRMIREGMRVAAAPPESVPDSGTPGPLRLAGTALATSVDACAVGASLALADGSYWVAAVTLAGVTFAMSFAGGFLGPRIGSAVGRRAEILGGVLLIAIGVRIAAEHVSAGI